MLTTTYDNNRITIVLLVFGAFAAVAATFYVGLNILPVRSLSMLSYLLLTMITLTAVLTWQPKLAAPLIIVSVFFSPDVVIAKIPGRDLNLRVEDGILVAALLALLIRYAAGRERISIPRTPVDKPILAYCVVGFISTLMGAYAGSVSPLRGFFFFGKRVEYFVLFYLLYSCLERKKDIKTAIWLVFICIFLVSIYNVYMRSTEIDVAQWRGYGPPGVEEIGEYGDIITLIFPIMLAVAIETRSASYIILTAISSAPIMFTLLDSLVRHAYIGGAVSLLFLAVYRFRLLLPVLAGAAAYTTGRAPERIAERSIFLWRELSVYFSTRSFVPGGSFGVRIGGIRQALGNFLYRPLMGKGLGSYGLASAVSHNQYSQVLLETGLLGLGFFLWIILSGIRYALRCVSTANSRLFRGFCIGYMAGVIGWIVSSLGAPPFSAIRTMETYIIMTAIAMACLRENRAYV